MITSKNWANKECVLIDNQGNKVVVGQIFTTEEGTIYSLTGGKAPHKPSSTGRIYVKTPNYEYGREFFPGVLDLQWVEC